MAKQMKTSWVTVCDSCEDETDGVLPKAFLTVLNPRQIYSVDMCQACIDDISGRGEQTYPQQAKHVCDCGKGFTSEHGLNTHKGLMGHWLYKKTSESA